MTDNPNTNPEYPNEDPLNQFPTTQDPSNTFPDIIIEEDPNDYLTDPTKQFPTTQEPLQDEPYIIEDPMELPPLTESPELGSTNIDVEGSSTIPSSATIQPPNELEDLPTSKYSRGEEKMEYFEKNVEIMVIVISDFPYVGHEFVDSQNIKAIHIGLLNQRNADNLQSQITGTEEYQAMQFGSEKQQESARLIKELFKPQKDIEGVVISAYGISRHLLFNPVERKQLFNQEEFKTMSIIDFDDTALDIFANALNIINEENKREIELASNSTGRIKDAFSKVKGPQNAFTQSSSPAASTANTSDAW